MTAERFLLRVAVGESCWEWLGYVEKNGYGSINLTEGKRWAHRLAHELLVGPIPEGMQIDHLCRNRRCVNPAHLEIVTPHENWRRGESLSAQYARATHCIRGHAFDETNTYRPARGGRQCCTCRRDALRAFVARRREAVAA